MKWAIGPGLALIATLAGGPALAEITGPAEVIDSDKIMVNGQRITLNGIDSVERDQTCSSEGQTWACWPAAVRQLQIILAEGPATCEEVGPGKFGYIYAKCTVGGKDVAEEMVRAGMALAFRDQSTDYVAVEEEAKTAQVGLWKGQFAEPWDFRRSKGRPPSEQ